MPPSSKRQEGCDAGPDLAAPEDDPELVLLAVLLVLLQLLPAQAHRHGPQSLVHSQIVPVLWGESEPQAHIKHGVRKLKLFT